MTEFTQLQQFYFLLKIPYPFADIFFAATKLEKNFYNTCQPIIKTKNIQYKGDGKVGMMKNTVGGLLLQTSTLPVLKM
ncbi:MAG: hypothetical protein WCX31_21455 [Salinivirgaceae bacterium]